MGLNFESKKRSTAQVATNADKQVDKWIEIQKKNVRKREKTEASDSLDSSGLSRLSEHAHPVAPSFIKGFKATKRMIRNAKIDPC